MLMVSVNSLKSLKQYLVEIGVYLLIGIII